MKKIIVAHPLQQHSYRTVEALDKINILQKYITTVYYQKDKKMYRFLEKILKPSNLKRMYGRKNKIVEKYLKTFDEFLGLLYLLIVRIDKLKIIEPRFYSLLTNHFGKKVYKYIKKNNTRALIMYDTTAYKCFKLINKSKYPCTKILDMSSVAAPYIRNILLEELSKDYMTYKKSIKTKLKSYSKQICKRYQMEIESADYFLVASNFVKKSLIYCGVNKEKILYVPYGVDIKKFYEKKDKINENIEKLKFLFVGRVDATKGIYYLIKAFEELQHLDIELIVVGSISSNDEQIIDDIRKNYNIIYKGIKTKDEMSNIYRDADVYIMSSLFEGFSLTLFEAMASNLPVIATKNSVADDVITDYKEGFLIDYASKEQIKEKILWFCNNKSKIPQMGKEARKLAETYIWENYNKNLNREIEKILK